MNGSTEPAQPNEPPTLISILVIGPRELPGTGTVRVWADAGSGAGRGQPITVSVNELTLSDHDRGEGRSALYMLARTAG